ncbi:MAG: glycosyltransferase family 4 protein [Candidatus Cryptobacteroides sp.]
MALELVYFRVADRFNIIDKPNERSSHSSIVLRGGGIIFLLGVLVWALAGLFGCFGDGTPVYPWFLLAVLLAAGISFVDDIKSLPDSVRLVVQFVAMGLLIFQLYVSARGEGLFGDSNLIVNCVFVIAALIVCVGATNVYNFMDGINGITAGYSMAVLVPLALVNGGLGGFIAPSFIGVAIIAVLVFAFFNFRPRGKAKCFAGDVGSVGIAFILLFAIGMLIVRTEDISWLIFLLVYGVDGCLTICHRILLHENLGEAHRKHAYQLMANELKMSHPVVSLIYMGLQLVVSLGFIYLCPLLASASGLTLVAWHWIYLGVSLVMLAVAYVLFKKKYYHLHEEYLASLNK